MNKPDMNNFLCQFDFSSLQQLDPCLVDGYNLSYSKDVPFEIRMQQYEDTPQEVGSLDVISVNIFVLGDELNAQSIKIVLTSETDLFFHFTQIVNENDFEYMQNNQKLMINFSEYLQVLIKMFNSCIKDPQSFLAIFTIKQNGIAQLEFIKNMEYKFIELLMCQFIKSSDEVTKENITYRYNVIKSKNGIMYNRLKDISILIKTKNPSLLMQLQKTASKQMEIFRNKKC
ncbi:conserved Plasmodium protein, unknown function [Plasmodium sp. gorilla clade G2]|uniref:conserved Plasmodium protein, unknown function n=1 Tax=Plasmodium sp. gorilla clade G2 TaxID=880535 RepID=UPI000D20A7B1|nr:conserved Plasmodium protein, unknown function [Plasmodium sp. gorilla clade G2]SOV17604.1 conserved Plasmodium protein, unknown function [Plasmodium sp. gorilla clade G2]